MSSPDTRGGADNAAGAAARTSDRVQVPARAAGFLGLVATAAIILGALIAAVPYVGSSGEGYSPLNHFISELGQTSQSQMAPVFNAGLVAGGAHPSPIPHADVVTTTTHKTLRGPRGGMILCRAAHASALDKAVFPGLQGGPHDHTTAGIAVALHEASQPAFREYAHNVVKNAAVIAAELMARGYHVVSGGTDNHLILVDLTNKNIPGKVAAKALDKAGIELNYNSVPYDTRKPFDPSGIRLGSPSVTSRGMGPAEMKQIAAWMDRVMSNPSDENAAVVAAEVRELTKRFPAPGITVKG